MRHYPLSSLVSPRIRAIVLVPAATAAVLWSATFVVEGPMPAHAQPPPGCEQDTIWGIGPFGIYEIKTQRRTVVKRTMTGGVTIAAGHFPYHLYWTDAAGNVFLYHTLTRASSGPLLGSPLPAAPNSLGNGWTQTLYAGTPAGVMYKVGTFPAFRTPPQPILVGFVGANGLGYSGDIARDPWFSMFPPPTTWVYGTAPSTSPPSGSDLRTVSMLSGGFTGNLGAFVEKGSLLPIVGPIDGLAFTQNGAMYAAEARAAFDPLTNTKIYHVENKNPGTSVFLVGADDPIVDLASEPNGYCREYQWPPPPPWGDLGDAADTTNNKGQAMSTYGGAVAAEFPTVHRPAEFQPSGPKHLSGSTALLGGSVSLEKEADGMPDNDGYPNIDPYTNSADDDGADDAVQAAVSLPHCQLTDFDFDVTISGNETEPRYVNVWIDYNRDGDWADTLTCIDPATQQPVVVTERTVVNFGFTVSLGGHTLTTPSFRSYDPAPGDHIWMRITLTRDTTDSDDGRGLLYPYSYVEGETEDYYLEHSSGSEYSP